MTANIFEVPFHFLKGAVTSRGTLLSKSHYFVCLTDEEGRTGWGECAPIAGLTPESEDEVRAELLASARACNRGQFSIDHVICAAVKVSFEMALGGLSHGRPGVFFHHADNFNFFVNGLVWMNDPATMLHDAKLLAENFSCVKMKIDGKNPEDCLGILKHLRKEFSPSKLRIRLDANGSFSVETVMKALEQLAAFDIDSIEQPIARGNWKIMADVCNNSPIPIALDEELIGVEGARSRDELLNTIKPHAIVLKPSLHGGFASCDDWLLRCGFHKVGWWATSYLESNLGLAALAQWLSTRDIGQTHGLGTGKLYRHNLEIPATISGGKFIWRGDFLPTMHSLPGMSMLC